MDILANLVGNTINFEVKLDLVKNGIHSNKPLKFLIKPN